MKKLTIDFETRSRIDIKKHGAFVYAQDPSTEVFCMAVKEKGSAPQIWVAPYFLKLLPKDHGLPLIDLPQLKEKIKQADITEAHNAAFEYNVWHEIMVRRFNTSPIEDRKWRCSAAKAASFSLPRSLGLACSALGLDQQKDNLGYSIMLKMCKPRTPTKHNPAVWHEDPKDFLILCQYCMQDTVAEEALSESLLELSEAEQEVWFLDQKINRRGIKVDVPAIENLISKINTKEKELLIELQAITSGQVKSARQIEVMCNWVNSKGVKIKDCTAETVAKTLKQDIPKDVRRVLEIRKSLAKSSVAKLNAMKLFAGREDRVRGAFIFNGANTGRWSGHGIQPQNMPRNSLNEKDIEEVLTLNTDMLEIFHGETFEVVSKCLRGMIIAGPGKKLVDCDYSAIEARVLAWLAGEEHILKAYREGADTYIMNAMDFFGFTQDKVTSEMRQIGKVVELSSGYQGWVNAFNSMAGNYGVYIEEEKAKNFISTWRRNRPATVALWRGLETAAVNAVKTKKPHAFGRIKFGMRGRFLHMRLPSGRLLSYCDPHMVTKNVHGNDKECLAFWAVDSTTNKWGVQYTYGGSLTENAVQAISRDLLVHSMFVLEKNDYPIVMHVHDEIVCEVDDNQNKNFKDMEKLMKILPTWAQGLPMGVSGWEGKRYRK